MALALLIYAALMALIALIYGVALPRPALHGKALAETRGGEPAAMDGTFLLIAGAIAFSGFVTFGLTAILVELLKQLGAGLPTAVATASILGVVQVGARGTDLLSRGVWNGLATGAGAAALMMIAMMALLLLGTSGFGLVVFVALWRRQRHLRRVTIDDTSVILRPCCLCQGIVAYRAAA